MDLKRELLEFINQCPTAYHTVDTVSKMLLEYGYQELFESEDFELVDGGKYFVRKNGSSIIAFRYNDKKQGFMICASHSDSPSFKVKSSVFKSADYTGLEVEKYGGMIYYSWLDRPLSVAGRAVIKTDKGLETRLVNFERDLCVIPSVAIHLNRSVNDGYKFNPAKDLLPLLAVGEESLSSLLEKQLCVSAENIAAHDLYLYPREKGKLIGANEDIILSPRLDDLACVFASLKAFLSASPTDSIPVFAVFDNEEVGSETKQGAASDFLDGFLREIAKEGSNYRKMLANSFMVSADNAHAKHPNHPELSDNANAPVLNGGVVVKYNANQKYATDAYSAALFNSLAERAGIRLQSYCNRADIPGGSTLGSISNTKVSVPTVDIGLPQLAMHSANETVGASDFEMLVSVLKELFSVSLCAKGGNVKIYE